MKRIGISSCIYIFVCCYMLCISMSCSETHESNNIDLRNLEEINIEPDLETLVCDIEIIPIYEDSEMLGSNPNIKLVNESGIYIEDAGTLKRYSHKGIFLNYIGRKGEAPDEYIYPGMVHSYKDNQLALTNLNRIQYFDSLGNFINAVPFPNKFMGVSFLNDSVIVAFQRIYESDGMRESIHWLSHDLEEYDKRQIYSDDKDLNVIVTGYPSRNKVNDTIYFRDEWSPDIWSIGCSDIKTYVTLDFGRQTPDRAYYQDLTMRTMADKKVQYIENSILDGHLLFLILLHNRTMRQVIIDIDSRKVRYSKKYVNEPNHPLGVELKEYPLFFWPDYISDDGWFYDITDVTYLTDEQLNDIGNKCGIILIKELNYVIIKAHRIR